MAAVGLSAWWGIYRVSLTEPEEAFATATFWQPWGGPAWQPAARRSLTSITNPQQRESILQRLGVVYPMSSDLWLGRARNALARDESREDLHRFLEAAASVDPGDAEVLWKAAMVAVESGDLSVAGGYLRRLVGLRPREIQRAVLVARRWLARPEALLETLAPDNAEAQAYLLSYAAHWQDWTLADAVWRRLPAASKADEEVVAGYVNRLLYAGFGQAAAGVWTKVDSTFAPGAISNGDFSRELRERSLFDWGIRVPEGVTMERDGEAFVSEPASLHIHFDGEHNVRLSSPVQYVAVRPGRTYTLSGQWKGEGLTTLSLPEWLVFSQEDDGSPVLARLENTESSWSWREFSMTFKVPQTSDVIQIQLRRNPTNNFDRFIGGDLWIDDVTLREE